MKIIYVRVSTDEQKDFGHSIQFQIEDSKKWIINNHDTLNNSIILNDEGYSASSLIRPAYNKMKEAIENGKVSEIYFTRLDRLNRSIIESIDFIMRCAELEVKLFSGGKELNINNPDEEFQVYLDSLLSYREKRIISFRTKQGILGGLDKNKWVFGGKAPFGYVRTTNNELAFDLKSKDIVTNIIKDYTNSLISIHQLSIIYDLGYSIIVSILEKDIYRGFKIHNNKRYKLTNDIYIDKITDNKIKTKLNLHKNNNKHIYLFKNKLYCSNCNSLLTCSSTKKNNGNIYLYYLCTNDKCEQSESRINEVIIIQSLHSKLIKIFNSHLTDITINSEGLKFENKIKNVKNKMAILDKKKERLISLYVNCNINDEQFKKANKKIESSIENSKNLINSLTANFQYDKYLKSVVINDHLEIHYIDLSTNTIYEINDCI